MKTLLNVDFPHEPSFNSLVRAGTEGDRLNGILESLKPQAACFTEQDGPRGAVLRVELSGPADVSRCTEPFFLNVDADCRFGIAISADELGEAGLGELGKRWA